MSDPRVFVVLTAAGQSRRMGGTDKLTLPLHGRPLLAHTAHTFLSWPRLHSMAVGVTAGREAELEETIRLHAPCPASQANSPNTQGREERSALQVSPAKMHVLAGGKERQDSIRLALEHLQAQHSPGAEDIVLIHDAARPFVDHALFESLLQALSSCDGVIPATPVRDTVKRVSGSTVLATEDRETLRMVQTPQAFRFQHILELHQKAHAEKYLGTDDASLVEHYGGKVHWIPGPAHNLKVTVPEDIALLSELVRAHS